jgi:hypothetical protein
MRKKEKFFTSTLTQLPPEITTKGRTYDLVCEEFTQDGGGWFYKYVDAKSDKPDFPVQAGNAHEIYYLCSMGHTKQEAMDDMLERLNTMTEIMTEEDLEKFWKEWNEFMKKKKKK